MLYYEQDLTLQEVGALTGVGDSRVSQIHTLAVKHLWAVMWETVVNCQLSVVRSQSEQPRRLANHKC